MPATQPPAAPQPQPPGAPQPPAAPVPPPYGAMAPQPLAAEQAAGLPPVPAAPLLDAHASQPGPDQPPAVLMDRVSRRFGDVVGIDTISLGVQPGAILGLIGPSGAGKTTTVRVLTGALAPTSGTVRVLGDDPRHFHRATRERLGYMPQSFVLYPDLTVAENVHFMGSLFGMLWRRRRQRVRAVLELVELWDERGRRASQLSGGMQRRLELACTLVHEPTVLFLDEPTAGVDPLLRQRIWQELHRLRETGCTLLVTTQYVGEAEYCDAVALISSGQLAALATPDNLRRKALGGDVLEVETESTFDVRRLAPIEGVIDVRQKGPTSMLVVCQDAGEATPHVVAAFRAAGAEIASSREHRPSFDELFGLLVEQHDQARAAGGGATAAMGGHIPTVAARPR